MFERAIKTRGAAHTHMQVVGVPQVGGFCWVAHGHVDRVPKKRTLAFSACLLFFFPFCFSYSLVVFGGDHVVGVAVVLPGDRQCCATGV